MLGVSRQPVPELDIADALTFPPFVLPCVARSFSNGLLLPLAHHSADLNHKAGAIVPGCQKSLACSTYQSDECHHRQATKQSGHGENTP